MKILGRTGLVKIDTKEEWERVRAAMLQAGFKQRGESSVHLTDANGKIVTDKEQSRSGGPVTGWIVELEALKQAGIEP